MPMTVGPAARRFTGYLARRAGCCLTCQPVAVETVVMVYSGELVSVPEVETSFCAMVTANVIDGGPLVPGPPDRTS